MKLWGNLALIALACWAGDIQAQACALPEHVDLATETTADWEKLDYAKAVQTYQICSLDLFAAKAQRKRYPGEDEMLASYRDAFERNRAIMAARTSFPPGGQVLQNSKANSALQRSGWEYGVYMVLSEMIHQADTCGYDNCPAITDLAGYGAHIGREPRAEARRIAREGRGVSMTPWFLLGNLTIERKSTDVTGQNLKSAFDTALFAHETALDDLAEARRVLNRAIEARDAAMDPLEAAHRKLSNRVNEMVGQYRLDPAVVRESAAYKNASERMARAERRMMQIDQAITHLVEERAEEAFGQARIAELMAERDNENAKADVARAEREALFAPELPPDVAAATRQLRRELADAKADLNRTGAHHSGEITRAEAKVHAALDASGKTSQARDEARHALSKWADNLRLLKITSVTTEHARLVESTEDELQRFQTQLDKLRAEVRERRDKLRTLDEARDEARLAMLRAANAANEANTRLAAAGFLSHLAQANIEIAFAAYDLVKSMELGPAGLATQVTQIYVMGYAFPPTYYDAARRSLSDYALGQAPPRSTEVVDVYEHLSLRPAAKSMEKQFVSAPFRRILKSLEESAAKAAVEGARATYMWAALDIAAPESANLLEAAWKKEAELAKVSKELAAMTGKAGRAAFAKAAGTKFGKDIIKGLAKEASKKAIAELIEGGQLEAYMLAQMELAQAVARQRHAGGLYWANHDAVVVLEAMLDGLERRQAEITDLIDERNAPFYVDSGYRIELHFADEAGVDVSRLDAELSLGGVPLERVSGTGTLIWSVPFHVKEKFDHSQPERLPLVLTVP